MNKHSSIEEIYILLTEINLIENKVYKKIVADIWYETWLSSDWIDLNDVPKSMDTKGISNIQHTRSVTKMAISTADILEEMYSIDIDYDVLIVSALLHDVSKVIEYHESGYTKYGESIQHGFYGVQKSLDHGLPLEIAHIINTHTHISRKIPNSYEGIIINYVDYLDSDILLSMLDKPLFLAKNK